MIKLNQICGLWLLTALTAELELRTKTPKKWRFCTKVTKKCTLAQFHSISATATKFYLKDKTVREGNTNIFQFGVTSTLG